MVQAIFSTPCSMAPFFPAAGLPKADAKFGAVSMQWPTPEELAAAGRIRKANQQAIEQLIFPTRDVIGDLRIVRFLRARHHKEAEAQEWYATFLKARLEDCPEIETKIRPAVIGMTPEEFNSFFIERSHPEGLTYPWVGHTQEGVGICMARMGFMDTVKFTEERDDIPMHQDYLLILASMEWSLWYLDEESHRQHRLMMLIKVVDMGGLGTDGRKIPIFVPKMSAWLGNSLKIMHKCYCEHDAMVLVLNAPFVFRIIWAFLATIVTAKQRSKLTILGSTSDAAVRKKLFHFVPAGVLPKELGGKLPSLQNVYPAPSESAIPDWIVRMKNTDFWPARNTATSEKLSEFAEPPTPQEAPEPAADDETVQVEIVHSGFEPVAKAQVSCTGVAEVSGHAPPAQGCCCMQ